MRFSGMKYWIGYTHFLLFTLIISGCTSLQDPETSQTFNGDKIIRLVPGKTAGQEIQPLRGVAARDRVGRCVSGQRGGPSHRAVILFCDR